MQEGNLQKEVRFCAKEHFIEEVSWIHIPLLLLITYYFEISGWLVDVV